MNEILYNKEYYQGDDKHCGSDECKKYDMHWWSYRYYAGLVKKYIKAGAILELGCAHGYLLSFLPDSKYKKYGKDISDYTFQSALIKNPKATFYKGDVTTLPEFNDQTIDLVIAKYVMEHLENPNLCLEDCSRVLKNNGYFIFSVPNTSSLLRKAKGEQWIGDRDPTHKSVLTPEEWKNLLKQNGFKIIKEFSDGWWDVPYIKYIPKIIQFIIFGWMTVCQIFFIGQWIPVKFGENLIIVARKN